MKEILTTFIAVVCTIGFSSVLLGCDDPVVREYGTPGNKCAENGNPCKTGYVCDDGTCVADDDLDGGADDSGSGGSGGSAGRGGSGGSEAGTSGSEAGTGGSDCEEFEICDGIDNDCDDETDEDARNVGGECDTGEPGLCREGIEQCRDGSIICVQEVEPTEEVCDGVDNDCDGETDEDYPAEGEACDTGEPGDCGPGTQRCRDGEMVCVPSVDLSDEICDGEDNDCDGQTDETCCDPRDPGAVCDTDEHCIPADDDSVPSCVGQAGTKGQNEYCADIDDCVASADCQVYSVDDSTSKICVEQCRIGEDDCADNTETCEAFDPPRTIGDQEWGVCKSLPPDAPSDWTCDAIYYGTGDLSGNDDQCDCGCGVFDPDCENATPAACDGCPPNSCGYNICTPELTFVANDNALCEERPEGWTCPPLTYGDGEECDCGCGILDSDCDTAKATSCGQYCRLNSCAYYMCDRQTFVPDDNTRCLPQPAGWFCPPGYLEDGYCDCGCGFVDVADCGGLTRDYCEYCGIGSCSPEDPDTEEKEMCTLIDAEHNAVCSDAEVPDEWICSSDYYLDYDCDCGCGVVDPDCLGNEATDLICSSCSTDSCAHDDDNYDSFACDLAELEPQNNSQCI